MNRNISPIVGFTAAYLVAGIIASALFFGGTPAALSAGFSDWTSIVLVIAWPLNLLFPEGLLFGAVGLLVGLGVLSLIENSRLPLTAPRRIPRLSTRRFGELAATLLVAEVVARLTTAAAFVAHIHLFGAYRGDPGRSLGETVAFYRDAVSFFTAYLDLPALVWVSHLLPEIGSVPSGGPNTNHVLRQIGEVQFFDGIGFALVVGYLVAVGISYVSVRLVSTWVLARTNRIKQATV